jgi:hydrogenase maturation factor
LRTLSFGKIPIDVLDRTVLRLTGYRSKRVLTGPKAGVDFAAVRLAGGYLIVSSDPITGISSGVGRYAVVVSANDVATSGNAPQFMESVILLPEGATSADLRSVAAEMDATARKLRITLVGGHTEVTPGLDRPIIMVTAFSFVKSFVSSEMAREGDAILMTKTAGIEGTAALAREATRMKRRLPRELTAKAASFERRLSVVPEATAAFRTGRVHAMHDCTEGGLLGAAYEMSLASGLGFEVHEGAVPVAETTRDVCRRFSIDPLRLIGSGSLLIAAPPGEAETVRRAVGRAAGVTRIGRFTAGRRRLVKRDGRETLVRAAPEDELWRALGGSR